MHHAPFVVQVGEGAQYGKIGYGRIRQGLVGSCMVRLGVVWCGKAR